MVSFAVTIVVNNPSRSKPSQLLENKKRYERTQENKMNGKVDGPERKIHQTIKDWLVEKKI